MRRGTCGLSRRSYWGFWSRMLRWRLPLMKKSKKHLVIDQILLEQAEKKMRSKKKAKKKIQSKWFPQNDLYITVAIVIVMGGLIILSKC